MVLKPFPSFRMYAERDSRAYVCLTKALDPLVQCQ